MVISVRIHPIWKNDKHGSRPTSSDPSKRHRPPGFIRKVHKTTRPQPPPSHPIKRSISHVCERQPSDNVRSISSDAIRRRRPSSPTRRPFENAQSRNNSSFDPNKRHRSSKPTRRPPENAAFRDFDIDAPVTSGTNRPPLPDPPISYPSRVQETIQVFPRDPRELEMEAMCYDITPDTRTNYPCTQEDLDASGGANRRMALSKTMKKRNIFAHPNTGPFVDAREAAREVFDHNGPQRTLSAAENNAINRLSAGVKRAGREPWGPDLAIKAFCDLDKVFFCGRLKGHVCLTWEPDDSFRTPCFAETGVMSRLGKGKCVIRLNAYGIFFLPEAGSGFQQMFATLLHEMCHAYEHIRAGSMGYHDKNFGTMNHAVNRRAWKLFGFNGSPKQYPRHSYAHNDEPRLAPEQHPSHVPPPPPWNQKRPAASSKSGQELYDKAFRVISVDSGTEYACTQSDLEATGGIARQAFPKDHSKDRHAARKTWFPHPNHGPFIFPRQACRDVVSHNDLTREPDERERAAVERLRAAMNAASHGSWGPDLIIKAFCDLDCVFFRGDLRGHVCVRWLQDWRSSRTEWGCTVPLGKGKCAIRMNAHTILRKRSEPLRHMFATMLHEMCHAHALTRVRYGDGREFEVHGRDFGTRYYAVDRRARHLFGLSLKGFGGEAYPRY